MIDSSQEVNYESSPKGYKDSGQEVDKLSARRLNDDRSKLTVEQRPEVMTRSRAKKLKEELSRMIDHVKDRHTAGVDSTKALDTVLLLQVESTLSTSLKTISTVFDATLA